MNWQDQYNQQREEQKSKAKKILARMERKVKKKARKKRRKQESEGYMTFGLNDKKWQKLRRRVFSAYGRVCMKCGSTGVLHVDHIKPKSKFPELAYVFDNLQVLCKDCNYEKSNKTCDDYRNKFEQEEYELSMLANMPEL